MKKNIFHVLCIMYCVLCVIGCGYTSRSLITNKFQTIYIPQFVNKIDITNENEAATKYKVYKPLLDSDITRAVIDKFLFDGNLKPVKEESADLTLKGELIEFRRDPLRYTSTDDVEEYRINMVVNITLWDNKENKLVWQESSFTGETTYFTTGSAQKSETTAINDAITDLARRIVERTVEQW
ncbi:MAG: hypothetical protein A2166_06010 [Omnitrophica WOR_2 bacterium RBG_13_41_10]|nr:MAG: hypothetical protein A2166_06010 [Omnitrophica WOR_2 bacterium RBG_13_41_10]